MCILREVNGAGSVDGTSIRVEGGRLSILPPTLFMGATFGRGWTIFGNEAEGPADPAAMDQLLRDAGLDSLLLNHL